MYIQNTKSELGHLQRALTDSDHAPQPHTGMYQQGFIEAKACYLPHPNNQDHRPGKLLLGPLSLQITEVIKKNNDSSFS